MKYKHFLAVVCWALAHQLNAIGSVSTVQPAWLSETRPPPRAQSPDVVNKVIDKILSGDDRDLWSSFTSGPDKPGPASLINASSYWTWVQQPPGAVQSESEALKFLAEYENEATLVYSTSVEAGWNYFTNLTEYNRKRLVESDILLSQFLKLTARKAKQFGNNVGNSTMRRLLKKMAIEGPSALPEDQFRKLSIVQSEMGQIFANAAVCEQGQQPPCTLRLEPDLVNIMATSKDYRQLYYVWLAWRNAVGPALRSRFMEMVRLNNAAAKLNGFNDTGHLWRDAYGSNDFEQQLEKAMEDIRPLYTELHAYIRRKLRSTYPQVINKDGAIPAHLLGSMWANSWINLYEDTVPFPGKWSTDPTPALFFQNYTVERMFRKAEDFYASMGFPRLPNQFWTDSILSRPVDRDALCLPTSVDFRNAKDFRVKMCAQVSADDFIRAHHELGQIYYFSSYKNQPIPFRDGANPAAVEAVGSTMATIARTPEYLHTIGLLPFAENNTEADINFLFRNALDHVGSLPYSLAVDKWRWRIFDGEYNEVNLNKEYWNLRLKYQGIAPPAERTERDFDAGSNFQIVQNMPNINYFVGYVMQFQLLKTLCTAAGHKGPLIKCNTYQSVNAGNALKAFMEPGASKPWPEILQTLTGDSRLDARPLLEYFLPLYQWLQEDNRRNGETPGWNWNITFANSRTLITPLGDSTFANGTRPVFDSALQLSSSAGVAFVGEDCTNGKQCLQNSFCNGTVCVCPTGATAKLQQCVSDDASGDFGISNGGFKLNIVENGGNGVTPSNVNATDLKLKLHTENDRSGASSIFSGINVLLVFITAVLYAL